MTRIKMMLLPLMLVTGFVSGAQSLNTNWSTELSEILRQFTACDESIDCAQYSGKSLNSVYKVNDLYSPQQDRYMQGGEIVDFLESSPKWQLLGHAYKQDVLNEAQQHANSKKAVVALYHDNNGASHMALILPGELQASGSWGLQVPNSASFLLADPARSYVGKGLSYAFAKHHLKDVVIFARSY